MRPFLGVGEEVGAGPREVLGESGFDDDGGRGGGDLGPGLVASEVDAEVGRCGSLGGTGFRLAMIFSQSCSVTELASEVAETSSYDSSRLIESASLKSLARDGSLVAVKLNMEVGSVSEESDTE